ncbi:hypothetical protein O7627_24155 [Solwaraspora sp. WMMD1047]|uniref:hypothetical protein n=1 Tax=Solwaraspora sp. WMMD1047 TaxID=3016102 RepID=UPI002416630A|nr:hypothetical protein [Solwaraspora sp. WMMD1047]MDG4832376.1 hypothetical protein [Solwaraspora sp. WMMD1047]
MSAASEPDGLTRVTVNLTPRAATALDALATAGPMSKTDAINRALRTAGRLARYADADGAVVLLAGDGRQVEIEVV